ncbi:Membrane protein involved in the export of O-antigen and teichoic acid [Flagellimonas taeanensis]|uniref:Membrane protein involved in the export of O-antigen and teichoic acid n=1 Tax=Flagellimonas taeanensis TaxID=1005926 RepID=A0A1M6QCF7_9FLAO|nr:oligosaccharide flippase family protein [Allomuricauda taeanensis]SFB70169.1 Membrane protein involved in the export of O-antigen and teichoic acid [Allomuricauda taeanensis]SHK17856.1 Membrane protein involved in the export of O-antigen and teichoic acid [Allomuricauda taeanensis]
MFSLNSKFSKNVLTLVSGTAIAQAIPLGLSPILTRIYSPNDFAIFAIYMSIAALGTTVVSLKYDLAIIIPEKDEDSANITVLSIIIAFIVSLILLIVTFFFNDQIAKFMVDDKSDPAILSRWLYFVPLSILLMGVFNAISFWFNRKEFYKRMAASKVMNTAGMTGIQIGLGSLGFSPFGLLLGFILGRLSSVLYLLGKFKGDKNTAFTKITNERMKALSNRYKRFPYYTLPAEFTNVISNQLPVFLIGKYFGGVILGNYSLMERVLNAPITLLGRSILDVFKQRASEDYINFGNCRAIYLKTFRTLVLLSIGPTALLFAFSPFIFGTIFGPEWRQAGDYARVFSILFFFKFTASPLSYMFHIAEKQHFDMFWQIGLLIFAVISFVVGIVNNSIMVALICFVGSYSLMYILNLYLSYSFAKGDFKS